jgi:hypothetical protein
MRSVERIIGCSINTVDKLLRDAGEVALAYHDEHVRGVKAVRIQCDEIWSFVHAKAKNAPKSKRAGYRTLTAGVAFLRAGDADRLRAAGDDAAQRPAPEGKDREDRQRTSRAAEAYGFLSYPSIGE